MAISKINLTDADRGLLQSSVQLRMANLEKRVEQAREEYEETKKEVIRKMIDYFLEELKELGDIAQKLYSSRSRGLIYEGEGTSEHIT